jgi:RNA-splicing ligase RtcB
MSDERAYEVIEVEGGVPIKAWIRGVSLEEAAAKQLRNVARLPCVQGWVAAMPDVQAGAGDLGIIPGSMGTRSYIVRGRGNPESYESCSHGAGRAMSRNEAKRRFTVEDHTAATAGIECRKDADVIDETPGAYKPIDAVMAAQRDLVEIVHTLRQVVCVKG